MNERGFILVGALAVLPFIVAVSALLGASYLLFKMDGASRHECRKSMLQAQTEIARDLNQLLAMNPRAASLRVRRQAAEMAVLASMGTPTAAAAKLELQRVVAEQTIFGAQQRALIVHAMLISRTGPEVSRVQTLLKVEKGRSLNLSTRNKTAIFKVVAHPLNSLTPDYRPAPNFRELQEMHLSWSYDVARFLPSWFNHFLGTATLRGTAECSATIEKETSSWQPKITRGKS